MSKKDFELIAEAIRCTEMYDDVRAQLIDNLASNLRIANSRFNRETFAAACQPRHPSRRTDAKSS